MGKANGSVVNPGTDIQVAGLRFFGVLLAWILLMLVVAVRCGALGTAACGRRVAASRRPNCIRSMPELRR